MDKSEGGSQREDKCIGDSYMLTLTIGDSYMLPWAHHQWTFKNFDIKVHTVYIQQQKTILRS